MRQPAAALGRFGISVRRFALSALKTASSAGSLNRIRRTPHNEYRESVKKTDMSSDFSSALANLDISIEALQAQLDCLRAALEVNDETLSNSLANADHHAARLRDLIRARQPGVDWMDRRDLDQLINGMADAKLAESQSTPAH